HGPLQAARLALPSAQKGHRVDGRATPVVAALPDLQMEVATGGVAGLADAADELAGPHGLARPHPRRFAQVGVDQLQRGALDLDHDVIAGATVVFGEADLA